jgi:hypothetical protein
VSSGQRGCFVSLEGGEGVGKSTQLQALSRALGGRGVTVVETREPGGSEGAEVIRELLLQGNERRWSIEAEALLFAAARADHVEKTIRPALERGEWVLSDRYIDSSIAYQGGAQVGSTQKRSASFMLLPPAGSTPTARSSCPSPRATSEQRRETATRSTGSEAGPTSFTRGSSFHSERSLPRSRRASG